MKYLKTFEVNMSDDLFLDASKQLLSATRTDDLKRIKELIKFGADINYKNNRGETPLNIAASMEYLDIVKYFIKKGADVNIVDNQGDNALMMPAINNNITIVSELINAKINIDNINNIGTTVLLHLSKYYSYSSINVIYKLLKYDANWLITDNDDEIFLFYLYDIKNIINKYPKKYQEYLKFKEIKEQSKKFNI